MTAKKQKKNTFSVNANGKTYDEDNTMQRNETH